MYRVWYFLLRTTKRQRGLFGKNPISFRPPFTQSQKLSLQHKKREKEKEKKSALNDQSKLITMAEEEEGEEKGRRLFQKKRAKIHQDKTRAMFFKIKLTTNSATKTA